jgi:hypothetical protein
MGMRYENGVSWVIRESTAAAVGVHNQAFKLWTSATLPFVVEIAVSSHYLTSKRPSIRMQIPDTKKGTYLRYQLSIAGHAKLNVRHYLPSPFTGGSVLFLLACAVAVVIYQILYRLSLPSLKSF